MSTEKHIIEREIRNATADSPITSTKLIYVVFCETGLEITARRVRLIVADLRENDKLPVLATRSGKQGYYFCHSREELADYKQEVRNHSLKEMATVSNIESSYFGTTQAELFL